MPGTNESSSMYLLSLALPRPLAVLDDLLADLLVFLIVVLIGAEVALCGGGLEALCQLGAQARRVRGHLVKAHWLPC